jgi:hypothetical protein
MKQSKQWIYFVALIVPSMLFIACQGNSHTAAHTPPAQVEHIDGTKLSRVILTERAAERLDIKTAPVQDDEKTQFKVVPYSSILYDSYGDTWVYTSPEHLVFSRYLVRIDRIDGEHAYLAAGPPVGTEVVAVGAAELYGTEFKIGH